MFSLYANAKAVTRQVMRLEDPGSWLVHGHGSKWKELNVCAVHGFTLTHEVPIW